MSGDGVKVQPAGTFPREDDSVTRAPEQLIFGHHGMECAAWAFGSVPELAPVSGIDVGEANGPGLRGRSLGTKKDAAGIGCQANECDLFSVGRPGGVGIAIDTCVEI